MLETIIVSAVVVAVICALWIGGTYLIRNHRTNANETARVERLQHYYQEMAKKYPYKGE